MILIYFFRCSAPIQVLSFVFLCIIIVFAFEFLGLVNREKNLDLRQSIAKGLCNNIYLYLIYK